MLSGITIEGSSLLKSQADLTSNGPRNIEILKTLQTAAVTDTSKPSLFVILKVEFSLVINPRLTVSLNKPKRPLLFSNKASYISDLNCFHLSPIGTHF